ncbi:MAG: TonB family protein [Oligoflexia bacterium]|nr:TonB family protein [Oligoflexia bacterium]
MKIAIPLSIGVHGAVFFALLFALRKHEAPTAGTATTASEKTFYSVTDSHQAAQPPARATHRTKAPTEIAPPANASPSSNSKSEFGAGSAPSAAAPADSAAKGGSSENISYFLRVRERIQKNLKYPRELRERRIQGQVKIEIAIAPSGALQSINVIESSGHPELDRIAVHSANSAAPYETFPSTEKARSLRVPIDFTLHFN